jgi:hypothetical protein
MKTTRIKSIFRQFCAACGKDIDVVAALERARSEVITEVRESKSKEEKKARGRSEWKEAV